jgi:hypothetical protein
VRLDVLAADDAPYAIITVVDVRNAMDSRSLAIADLLLYRGEFDPDVVSPGRDNFLPSETAPRQTPTSAARNSAFVLFAFLPFLLFSPYLCVDMGILNANRAITSTIQLVIACPKVACDVTGDLCLHCVMFMQTRALCEGTPF